MFKNVDTYLIFSEENRFYFTGFHSSFGCVILSEKGKYFITDPRYASEAKNYVRDFNVISTVGGTFYDDIEKVLQKVDAKKIGFDPAVMASPLITTIVDAMSLVIYFNIATMVLNF